MAGTGSAGVSVLSEQPQCHRLCGGQAVCGKAGLLRESAGGRGICPGTPRESGPGAAPGDRNRPAGRTAASFMRHFLHGTGNRRGGDRPGAAGGLSPHDLQYLAEAGPGRAQSLPYQRHVSVSQNRGGMRALRHDCPACQRKQGGKAEPSGGLPGYIGPASGLHGGF